MLSCVIDWWRNRDARRAARLREAETDRLLAKYGCLIKCPCCDAWIVPETGGRHVRSLDWEEIYVCGACGFVTRWTMVYMLPHPAECGAVYSLGPWKPSANTCGDPSPGRLTA